jgi:hypothetical protein
LLPAASMNIQSVQSNFITEAQENAMKPWYHVWVSKRRTGNKVVFRLEASGFLLDGAVRRSMQEATTQMATTAASSAI